MKCPCSRVILVLLVFSAGSLAHADGPKDNLPEQVRRIPKLGIEVTSQQRQRLESELDQLRRRVVALQAHDTKVVRDVLPDLQVIIRAVSDALEYQEFFRPQEVEQAHANLQLARERLDEVSEQPDVWPSWTKDPGLIVRGFVSKIDRTVQPYGLVVPDSYTHQSARGYRLDVWFHGRGETLSENNFITQRRTSAGTFQPAHTIVLHPYGRYSNAFKFAGETDVLEAIDDVRRRYHIDEDRISVRGFSMGGAACWQFAVHYADRWFAANPGAGFAETPEFLRFFQQEKLQPTWFERKLWGLYDCNLWATNLLHCPVVAYSGERDIQKQAADIMESALDEVGVKLVHVIGPETGHRYHPDAAQEVTQRLDALAKRGRDRMPLRIDFSTRTLKYHRMHWVHVDALEEHWQPTVIRVLVAEPTRISVVAKNVAQFSFRLPSGAWPFSITPPIKLFINGKGVDVLKPQSDRSLEATFHLSGEEWKEGPLPASGLRKRHGLQGPIDDAFMDSFLFVRPTGTPRHAAIGRWAEGELTRAIEHWRRHFRGVARVKLDTEVTQEDMEEANLVLWGDPQSNKLLGELVGELPIAWGPRQVQVGKEAYDAAHHALIAIYPNPRSPERYLVLNSGFTYRDYAYLNNARQVPKLPDWALIDVRTPPDNLWPGKVVRADFFDERWQLKE